MSEESDEESSNGIRAPIIGYEVVDRREKFTVFKIHVSDRSKSWFVFRRYTDFVRLNDKLQDVFPGFHFKLPLKRWFKNNFDPDFIEDRAHGLQFFINNVMHHGTICTSDIVKEFLCLDDPPGPYDSLEESRAYCQQLEDDIDDMKEKVHDLTSELSATKSQLLQARVQQEALVSSLKEERSTRSGRNSATSSGTSESFRAIGSDHKGISSHREGLDSRETDPARRNIGTSRGSTWFDSLDVTSHSNGVHKIKPAQRSSNVLQPLTSTPDKDSNSKPFQNEDDSLLEVSREGNVEGAFGSDNSEVNSNRDTVDHIELEEDATDKSSSNSAQLLEEAPGAEHNPVRKELTEKSTEQDKSTQPKSKRDSGIIFDSSLSPTID